MPLTLLLAGAAVADLVLVGGRVHTMDERQAPAQAIAVRGDRILAVGTDAEIRRLAGPGTRVLDLGGRTVMPGLIDTHTHAFEACRSRVSGWLDLGLPDVRSLADAVARVRKADAGDGWILGDRWDESKWPERRYLRRGDLDPVTGDRPAYFEHVSGHAATVNSAALVRSGITRDTPDPIGGAIEKDAKGEPTGVLKDTAMAWRRPTSRRRPSGAPSASRPRRGPATRRWRSASPPSTIRRCRPKGCARTRKRTRPGSCASACARSRSSRPTAPTRRSRTCARWASTPATAAPRLRWGAVKFFTDGGMAARTIAVTAPGLEADPANVGLLRWETPKLAAAMKAVHELGWQITAHAIGDRAIAQVLDALEIALGPEPGDHRSRIVHCGVTTPALLDRIARLKVAVDHNPPFVYWIGDWFRNYGEARAQAAYRGRSYEQRGIRVAGGSDFGVTPLSPWWGLWSAVERREYRTGDVLGADETVDARTAFRWYTANGAWAGFDEKDAGTLAPGHWADLIVLDRDPLAVPAAQIKDTRVLGTLVGGEVERADAVLRWPAR